MLVIRGEVDVRNLACLDMFFGTLPSTFNIDRQRSNTASTHPGSVALIDGLRSILCSQRPFVVVRLLEHPERYTKMGGIFRWLPGLKVGIVVQSYTLRL